MRGRTNPENMNLCGQTIDRFAPVQVGGQHIIKNKAVDLFPDTIVEKMWAARQSSGTTHRYLYRYALVMPVVSITV